jgi:hypothetical protein
MERRTRTSARPVVIPNACLPDELADGIRQVLDRLAHVEAALKPER